MVCLLVSDSWRRSPLITSVHVTAGLEDYPAYSSLLRLTKSVTQTNGRHGDRPVYPSPNHKDAAAAAAAAAADLLPEQIRAASGGS